MLRRSLTCLCLLLAIGLVPLSASADDPAKAEAPEAAEPKVEARSAIAAFELDDLAGNTIDIAELKGKVVVISFWATWCAPCLQELPHLNGFYVAHEDEGLVVLAISTDAPESAPGVRRIARRQKWKMPVLLDTEGTVSGLLNPRGTNPFTLFVDRQGRVASTHEGYTPGDEAKYKVLVKKLLAEGVE